MLDWLAPMNPTATKARRPGISRVLRGDRIPAQITGALEKAGIPASRVVAVFPADLSPDGRFSERWFVVAHDRVAALEGDGTRVSAQEPFKGMTGLEYRKLVGGGLILVKRGALELAARGEARGDAGLDDPVRILVADTGAEIVARASGPREATLDDPLGRGGPTVR